LERYKLPGNDQIPADMIQAEGQTLWSGIHKLSNSIWNKEELLDQWEGYIIVLILKKGL
jgi:hypothetical protein